MKTRPVELQEVIGMNVFSVELTAGWAFVEVSEIGVKRIVKYELGNLTALGRA
jgi:hypothetical protein